MYYAGLTLNFRYVPEISIFRSKVTKDTKGNSEALAALDAIKRMRKYANRSGGHGEVDHDVMKDLISEEQAIEIGYFPQSDRAEFFVSQGSGDYFRYIGDFPSNGNGMLAVLKIADQLMKERLTRPSAMLVSYIPMIEFAKSMDVSVDRAIDMYNRSGHIAHSRKIGDTWLLETSGLARKGYVPKVSCWNQADAMVKIDNILSRDFVAMILGVDEEDVDGHPDVRHIGYGLYVFNEEE